MPAPGSRRSWPAPTTSATPAAPKENAAMANAPTAAPHKLYDDEAEVLMAAEHFAEKITLLPSGPIGAGIGPGAFERIRVMWGQDMLRDMLDGRYRCVV